MSAQQRLLNFCEFDSKWSDEKRPGLNMKEARLVADRLGISPMPKQRDALRTAVCKQIKQVSNSTKKTSSTYKMYVYGAVASLVGVAAVVTTKLLLDYLSSDIAAEEAKKFKSATTDEKVEMLLPGVQALVSLGKYTPEQRQQIINERIIRGLIIVSNGLMKRRQRQDISQVEIGDFLSMLGRIEENPAVVIPDSLKLSLQSFKESMFPIIIELNSGPKVPTTGPGTSKVIRKYVQETLKETGDDVFDQLLVAFAPIQAAAILDRKTFQKTILGQTNNTLLTQQEDVLEQAEAVSVARQSRGWVRETASVTTRLFVGTALAVLSGMAAWSTVAANDGSFNRYA